MKKQNNQKQKCLATLQIDNKNYSIRATAHSLQRMAQRKVDEYVVTGNILALGKERIAMLQAEQEEAIIVDEIKNVSIVIAFNKNTIKIVTVIDKAKTFVKSSATIINL